MTPTLTLTIEYYEALVESIVWQATLADEDGSYIATFPSPSAHQAVFS